MHSIKKPINRLKIPFSIVKVPLIVFVIPDEYAGRNRAIANQQLSESNTRWKWATDYNRRSIADTAMYRVKLLFRGSLTLLDYDGQVAEALAMVRALKK